ncbi:Ribonucleoprotein LSM domain [Pelomyxa schiedti]|nr:Ribonucleoprotein LSM domain [Pelomyxa schiedti]
MLVFVKGVSGETMTFQVSPMQTVSSFKCMLEYKLGTLLGNERLLFGGKQLVDEATLADYDVRNESTIHLTLSLLGGLLPSSLLRTAVGHQMLVELKNGETYNGQLVSCDAWMNIILRKVTCTSRDCEKFWRITHCYIKGTTVKYLNLEEEVLEKVEAPAAPATPEEMTEAAPPPTTGGRGGGRGRGRGKSGPPGGMGPGGRGGGGSGGAGAGPGGRGRGRQRRNT